MQSQPHYYLALHPHNLAPAARNPQSLKDTGGLRSGPLRAAPAQRRPSKAAPHVRGRPPRRFIRDVNNGPFSSSPAISKQTSVSILFMPPPPTPTPPPHLPHNGFNSPGQARHGERWPHRVTSSSTVGVFFLCFDEQHRSELQRGLAPAVDGPGAAHLDRQVLLCPPPRTNTSQIPGLTAESERGTNNGKSCQNKNVNTEEFAGKTLLMVFFEET